VSYSGKTYGLGPYDVGSIPATRTFGSEDLDYRPPHGREGFDSWGQAGASLT
jgi:hypothetical protein